MHRLTQTHEDVAADLVDARGRPPARLIRFFRADAPAMEMDEFYLERDVAWTLGGEKRWTRRNPPATNALAAGTGRWVISADADGRVRLWDVP